MPEHINSFSRGVDRDTSRHSVDPSKATGLLNFHLSEEGKNALVLVTLQGNEHQFSLTPGFVPMGHAIYLGVAYIFSFNPATQEGEVGSFPSPSPDGSGGFVSAYRPLQNWNGAANPSTGVVRQDFRTTLFAFDALHQLEVEPRLDYDGSVNLYFTDFKEPLRVINSGFHNTSGIYTQRVQWVGSWQSGVHVFYETCAWPQRQEVNIIDGGNNKAGNYFLFFRYLSSSLDASNYNTQIGPIQLAKDLPSSGMLVDGAAGDTDTNKTIEVVVSGLDPGYAFLQVAVVRHFEGTFEVWLHPEKFPIDPSTTEVTIRITGNEEGIDHTIADIVDRTGEETVVRSLAQVDNMMWGGNWKSSPMPFEDMESLATQVRVMPAPADSLEILPDWWYGGGQPTSTLAQYKDHMATLDKVGYFRGEAYPFAIVFVFHGGLVSKPYPVTGHDAWFDPSISDPNNRGILRMPSNLNDGYHLFGGGGPRVLGVRFDTASVSPPAWFSKVCGFYFVRGERKPDLIYQGVWSNTWWMRDSEGPVTCEWINIAGIGIVCNDIRQTYASNNAIPEFSGLLPFERHTDPNVGSSTIDALAIVAMQRTDRFAIFSTDHFFRKELDSANYTLVPQGRWTVDQQVMSGSREPAIMFQGTAFTARTSYDPFISRLLNMAERNTASQEGLTSAYIFGDNTTVGGPLLYYIETDDDTIPTPLVNEVGNRPMAQRNYIGVNPTADGSTSPVDVASGEVINIYDGDPQPISMGGAYNLQAKFIPGNTLYFPISEMIPIDQWAAVSVRTFYQGDCFLQRTWHRHLHSLDGAGWSHSFESGADNDRYYRQGNIAGFVQECSINTAMRYEAGVADADQRYYPEKAIGDPVVFAAQFSNVDESRLRNAGYDQTLGIRSQLGLDQAIPFRGNEYPARIRYTHTYVPNSFSDAYRQWDHDAFRDFNHRSGPITLIGPLHGRLMSVQDSAISLHYTNDRALLDPSQGQGQLVLGIGERLSEKAQVLTDEFGSQHQWSMIKTEQGWYGYDQQKRKFWRVTGGGLDIISDRLSFRSDALSLSQVYSSLSDTMHRYPDAPVCIGGVTGWFDRKHNEVGWTFLLYDTESPTFRTIVFNEKYDMYLHERSNHSPYSILLNEDFYQIDPRQTPGYGTSPIPTVGFWLKDRGSRLNFFSTPQEASLSFAAHPMPVHPSVFDGLSLSSNDIPPAWFHAETEFQSINLNPFLSVLEWETPMYKENRWKMSILTATAVFGNGDHGYGVGSRMRGRMLEVTFGWRSEHPVIVEAATINFRPSFQ